MNKHWQSVLHPAGLDAHVIAQFTWVLSAAGLLILGGVMALLFLAVYRGPRPVSAMRWVAGLGIAFPVGVLTVLLLWSAWRSGQLAPQTSRGAMSIAVTGKMWWWEVRYGPGIVSANEIRIPAGRTVYLSLTSSDVIHSLWIPNLAGKMDLLPGRMTGLTIRADRPGVYRAQCAEYCGLQHARMALHVVALAPQDFDAWLANERRPATATALPGRQVFETQRCGSCHTIRGVSEGGKLGPDLTHVGSRTHLAAGVLRNHRGTLAGWIGDPQAIKPGARMPAAHLGADDLQALAAWLEQLK